MLVSSSLIALVRALEDDRRAVRPAGDRLEAFGEFLILGGRAGKSGPELGGNGFRPRVRRITPRTSAGLGWMLQAAQSGG